MKPYSPKTIFGASPTFTSSVRKRRSFLVCAAGFFGCFVFLVHENMGVRMEVRMPVGLASTALPRSLSKVSVFDGCAVPFPSLHLLA